MTLSGKNAKISSSCLSCTISFCASHIFAVAFNDDERGTCFLAGTISGLCFLCITCCWLLPILFFFGNEYSTVPHVKRNTYRTWLLYTSPQTDRNLSLPHFLSISLDKAHY